MPMGSTRVRSDDPSTGPEWWATGGGSDAMFHPNQVRLDATDELVSDGRGRSSCLVAGCPCKDARIVSHRRAAFFAAIARRTGETASRVIAPDAGWRLPAPTYA
jgi:hypothetical protein